MEFYDPISVEEVDVDFQIPQCNGQTTPMLQYNRQFPGPLIQGKVGVQALTTLGTKHQPTVPAQFPLLKRFLVQAIMRFTNLIDPNSANYPATGRPWGRHFPLNNLCAERPQLNGNAPGTGRGISVHHHGLASLAPFDGWAQDVVCFGETKSYVLSHDDAGTFWYHDHALGTTSESTYAGLEGMHIIHPCTEPFNIGLMPLHVLQLNDVVFDERCHLLNDRIDYHFDDIYGDVNLVNGVRWPVFTTQPRWVRFKQLSAAPSRPWILKILDSAGANIASSQCWIVGSDGGYVARPRRFPDNGLLAAVAYRWDFVCDFGDFDGQDLYLYNEQDEERAKDVPFFCFSHLLMKIHVESGLPLDQYSQPIRDADEILGLPADQWPVFDAASPHTGSGVLDILGPEQLARAQRRALDGDFDREIKFGSSGNVWLMNGQGWDTNVDPAVPIDPDSAHISFDDVGQDTVEIWQLVSGGGWFHPVHVHLIDFVILSIDGDPPPDELALVSKDVIQIGGDVGKVLVAARYGPNLGKYMFHCHNGVHEDRDMLRAFVVRDASSGLTALSVIDNYDAFRNQGAGFVAGDGRDSDQFPLAVVGDSSALAAGYLNMDLYLVFYPVPSRVSPESFAILNDTATNPWLVTLCA